MNIHDNLHKRVSAGTPLVYRLWEPQQTVIVLGNGSKADQDIHLERCRADGIPILKRRGGGGTVVLMPGVLCLSIAFISQASISPHYFFKQINQFIIEILEQAFCIEELSLRGISDIALGDRKCLGCSMFKSRSIFLYQGSLLVNPDLSLITAYLHHPPSEPDYRSGRTHARFVTSLVRFGYPLSLDQVKEEIQLKFEHQLCSRLT